MVKKITKLMFWNIQMNVLTMQYKCCVSPRFEAVLYWEWAKIPSSRCAGMMNSYHKYLAAVTASEGAHTRYESKSLNTFATHRCNTGSLDHHHCNITGFGPIVSVGLSESVKQRKITFIRKWCIFTLKFWHAMQFLKQALSFCRPSNYLFQLHKVNGHSRVDPRTILSVYVVVFISYWHIANKMIKHILLNHNKSTGNWWLYLTHYE